MCSAKDVVFKAIEKGKHVITANKALIATFMTELIDLLAKHPSVKFLFEASVGGGIPIINTLQSTFPPDSVTRMCGIMNGTTNFMLSKMALEGADYGDVLKEAQDLGFAEVFTNKRCHVVLFFNVSHTYMVHPYSGRPDR
jgi:homoserine dehydrogenase